MTLATLSPQPDRSRRVRATCRERLERQRRRSDRLAMAARIGRRVAVPVAALLGAIYVADLFGIAVQTLSHAM